MLQFSKFHYLLLVFVVFSAATSLNYFSDVEAAISDGTSNPEINSDKVCGDELCIETSQSFEVSPEYCHSLLPQNIFYSYDITHNFFKVFENKLYEKSEHPSIFDAKWIPAPNGEFCMIGNNAFYKDPQKSVDFSSIAENSTSVLISKTYDEAGLAFNGLGIEASMKQTFSDRETITDNTYVAVMEYWNIQYVLENNINSFTEPFAKDLKELPGKFNGNQNKYFEFLKKWGTHYVSELTYGGRAQISTTLESHSDVEVEEFEIAAIAKITDETGNTYTANTTVGHDSSNTKLKQKLFLQDKFYGGDPSKLKHITGLLADSTDWIETIEDNPVVIKTKFSPIYEIDSQKRLELKNAYDSYLDGDMKIIMSSLRNDDYTIDAIDIERKGVYLDEGKIFQKWPVTSINNKHRQNSGMDFEPHARFQGAFIIYDVENDKVIHKEQGVMSAPGVNSKIEKYQNENVVITLLFSTNNVKGFAEPLFHTLHKLGGVEGNTTKLAPYVYFYVGNPVTKSFTSDVHYPIDDYRSLKRAYDALEGNDKDVKPNKVKLRGSHNQILLNVWEWAGMNGNIYHSDHVDVKKKQIEDYLYRLSHNCSMDVELKQTSSGFTIDKDPSLHCKLQHEPGSERKIN